MENPAIALLLDEMADLLEIEGANPFRVRAYRNAARIVQDESQPVRDLATQEPDALLELPGIGKDLAARITETASRVRVAFASACPDAVLFRHLAGSIRPGVP